jgi:hypothetical protein
VRRSSTRAELRDRMFVVYGRSASKAESTGRGTAHVAHFESDANGATERRTIPHLHARVSAELMIM